MGRALSVYSRSIIATAERSSEISHLHVDPVFGPYAFENRPDCRCLPQHRRLPVFEQEMVIACKIVVKPAYTGGHSIVQYIGRVSGALLARRGHCVLRR